MPTERDKSSEQLSALQNSFTQLATRLSTHQINPQDARPLFLNLLNNHISQSHQGLVIAPTNQGNQAFDGLYVGQAPILNYAYLHQVAVHCGEKGDIPPYSVDISLTQLRQIQEADKAIKDGVLAAVYKFPHDDLTHVQTAPDPKAAVYDLLGGNGVFDGLENEILKHIKDILDTSHVNDFSSQVEPEIDLTDMETGDVLPVYPDNESRYEFVNGMEVVGHIGNPESLDNPASRKLVITTTALQQLNDILIQAVNPGQDRGELREIGFYALGPNPQLGECRERNIVIADEWHLISGNVPSSVVAKDVGNAFTSEAWRMADDRDKYVTVRGHDHHEVAMANPSGQDKDELGLHIMPVDVIVKRSRQPLVISAWSTNFWNPSSEQEFSFSNDDIDDIMRQEVNIDANIPGELQALKGFYIVRDNDITDEDLGYLMAVFAYQNPDRSITSLSPDGIAFTGELDVMTQIRPDFPGHGGAIQDWTNL